jgi:hypothetical protein
MGKRHRLRIIIESGQHAYALAADPTPQDPSRKFDPTDLKSRRTLLMVGIDIKYIVNNYLASIPENRAQALSQWIEEAPAYSEYQLTEYYQKFLKWDIKTLKLILLDNKYG